MRRHLLLLLTAVSLFLTSAAHGATLFLKARLDGPQAGVASNGDGAALLTYDTATRQLGWTVTYRNLSSAAIDGHIHGPAEPGQSAGVVVPFAFGPSPVTGSATITASQEADMLAGLWYVNIHSSNFPLGEIRGQISLVDTVTYNVPMDGAQAGTPGSPIPTSGTGGGTVTFDPATMQMSWNLTFSNLTSPTNAAHFHGPAQPFESAGAIVGTGITSPVTGSAALTAVQGAEVVNGFWYYNVHTDNFPLGEIRGQLLPVAPRLANISTRARVQTGDDVMIGGFIIGGPAAKTVVVAAYGPSLSAFGIGNPVANPTLTLVRQSDGAVIGANDNWGDASNASQIQAAGFAPSNALESAIMMTLAPGAYTGIVSGVGGGTGTGIVAVYEVDRPETPLINISTRARVLTGDDVMIGGFIIQGSSPQTVAIVATGPSLAAFGIASPLANPTLTLVRQSDGAVIAINDNWRDAANYLQIQAEGFAPSNNLESAILVTLAPGAYTGIVSGVGGGTGVGIVAVYAVR